MKQKDYSNIEERIRDSLRQAVETVDFAQLRRTITDTVNTAVGQVHKGLSSIPKAAAQPPKPVIVVRYPSQVASVLCIVFGTIGTAIFSAIGLLGLLAGMLLRMDTANFSMMLGTITALIGVSVAGLVAGVKIQGKRTRLKKYLQAAGAHTYCQIEQLAKTIHKTPVFVRKDIRRMIQQGVLPEAHLDNEESCLILDSQTYEQYLLLQESLRERKRLEQEQAKQAMPEDTKARDMIEEGEKYIASLRDLNRKIPGEAISAKLDRLEFVLRKIFDTVRQHPEQAGEMQRFMEYYLPTTFKLVQNYLELDTVNIEGDNIRTAKNEIERTLDTINSAFERLLDELYQELAFDTSTDASVLETMLKRDGWTGSDFDKEDHTL